MWCYVKITYYIQIYCITEKIPHDSYLVNDLVSGAWTDGLKIWGCPVKKSWEIKFCFWGVLPCRDLLFYVSVICVTKQFCG